MKLFKKRPTLAELLKARGYEEVTFVRNGRKYTKLIHNKEGKDV